MFSLTADLPGGMYAIDLFLGVTDLFEQAPDGLR
jgi:hypothetical protein